MCHGPTAAVWVVVFLCFPPVCLPHSLFLHLLLHSCVSVSVGTAAVSAGVERRTCKTFYSSSPAIQPWTHLHSSARLFCQLQWLYGVPQAIVFCFVLLAFDSNSSTIPIVFIHLWAIIHRFSCRCCRGQICRIQQWCLGHRTTGGSSQWSEQSWSLTDCCQGCRFVKGRRSVGCRLRSPGF